MILKRVWDKSPKYQKNEMTNSDNWNYHLVFIFELEIMPCSQHYYQVRDIELRFKSSLCI